MVEKRKYRKDFVPGQEGSEKLENPGGAGDG
jgi:hypothetical protein